MARWLQSTVVGAINAELRDPAIPVVDAQFSRSGDSRDFWTESLDAHEERIALTWYQLGEPFLVHTQPNSVPGRPYGMCTVLIPALGARLTRKRNRSERAPLTEGSRRAPLQHLCVGIMRKLDGGQVADPREEAMFYNVVIAAGALAIISKPAQAADPVTPPCLR